MQRLNESELMINPENVKAFLNGDKSYGITGFLELYEKYVNINSGKIIDLGSGTAEYLIALESKYPKLNILGFDGSEQMVKIAQDLIEYHSSGVCVRHKNFSDVEDKADCVISTNTLHHIHDTKTFWNCVKNISNMCFIFDFLRPENTDQAKSIVEYYASNESKLFQQDYYNSLLASFSLEEIEEQIKDTNLKIEVVKGKHQFARSIVIYGNI
jgi:trans-aconitate methyltransferase